MEGFIHAKYRTSCYHCHEDADQIITAVPNVAQVVCGHCGSTRAFIPVMEDVTGKGDYIRPGCYDLWQLAVEAPCRHCGVNGPHEVTIGCRNFTVKCRNCAFTHLYRFNLEYTEGETEERT